MKFVVELWFSRVFDRSKISVFFSLLVYRNLFFLFFPPFPWSPNTHPEDTAPQNCDFAIWDKKSSQKIPVTFPLFTLILNLLFSQFSIYWSVCLQMFWFVFTLVGVKQEGIGGIGDIFTYIYMQTLEMVLGFSLPALEIKSWGKPLELLFPLGSCWKCWNSSFLRWNFGGESPSSSDPQIQVLIEWLWSDNSVPLSSAGRRIMRWDGLGWRGP